MGRAASSVLSRERDRYSLDRASAPKRAESRVRNAPGAEKIRAEPSERFV